MPALPPPPGPLPPPPAVLANRPTAPTAPPTHAGGVASKVRWLIGRQSRFYAGSLVLQGVGALLGLVVQTTLARWLSPSGYGIVSTVLALTTVLGIIGTLGTNGAALRYIPHFELHGEPEQASRFVAFSLTTTLMASTTIGFVFAAVALGSHSKLSVAGALASAALIVLTALNLAGTDLARLAKRFTASYAAVLVVRQALIAGCALVALLVGIHRSTTLGLVIICAGTFIAFAIQADAIRRGFGVRALRIVGPTWQWLKSSTAYVFITAFQILLGQIDLLAVSVFLVSAAVGFYAASLKISAVLTLPYVAVVAVITPSISRLASQPGSKRDAIHLATRATAWCVLATSALALPMILWPDPVLRLFGASFTAGHFTLQVLALGQVSLALSGPGGLLLIYMDRRRVALASASFFTVVSAILCGIGALVDGINGAAVASAASSVLIGGTTYLLAWRYTGIRVSFVEAFVPRTRQRLQPAD